MADIEQILADHNLPHPNRRKLENGTLILCGYRRMQRVYLKCIHIAKYFVVDQQIMQASDFVYARHKHEDGRRVRNVRLVLVAYGLHEANDQVVRDVTFIKKVAGVDSGRGITWFELRRRCAVLAGVLVIIFISS